MKALLIFSDSRTPQGWGERYDEPACNSEADFIAHGESMAANYNATLFPGDRERTFVRVEELTEGKCATENCQECSGTGQNEPDCPACQGEGFDDEGYACEMCLNVPCPACK